MRFFRVSVKGGQQPVRIIADTMEEAKRQAQEMARDQDSRIVQFYEVFPRPAPNSVQFDQAFRNIFA